jgi:phosphoglycerate dehydrogenase-like enzyme
VLTVLVSSRFEEAHVEALRAAFQDVSFFRLPEDGAVPERGRGAEVIFRCGMPKSALRRALADAPGVRWIHTCTAGVDWLLVPEVEERGIAITRSQTTFSVPIGEFVVGCIFLLSKRFPMLLRAQAAREWAPHDLPAEPVAGKSVGIVGAGAIGAEVAWRCAALGMRVLGIKRTPSPLPHFKEVLGPDGLPRLLDEADFLVLACPLTPETRGMIGEPQLRRMKRSAYLINIARGGLTVEADLVRALRERRIAGACLDTFDREPLPRESPLWDLDNAVITPHFSYSSPNGLDRAVEEFKRNLKRYSRGEPLAVRYDRERGY